MSFNRHQILREKINFWKKYSSYDINFFIIDGSKKKLAINKKKISSNINYIHYPTEDYHKRLNLILKYSNSKYSQLQNDDDYFDPVVLLKSCENLEKKKNKNYTSVIGKSSIYSTYKKKLYIKELFISDEFKENNNDEPLKRLKSNYVDQEYSPALYFSIMRTSLLIKIIKIFNLCRRDYGDSMQIFAETVITTLITLAGKTIYLNDLFWIRHDSDIKKRTEYKKIESIIGKGQHNYAELSRFLYTAHQKENFLHNFFKNITQVLNIKKNVPQYIDKIDHIFMTFHKNNYEKNIIKNKKKIVLKWIIILIPVFLKKFLRFRIFKINGVNVGSICMNSYNANYDFSKKFLINLQNHINKRKENDYKN